MSEKCATAEPLTLVSINHKLERVKELVNENYNILLDVGNLHPSTDMSKKSEEKLPTPGAPGTVIGNMNYFADEIIEMLERNNEHLRAIRMWGGLVDG